MTPKTLRLALAISCWSAVGFEIGQPVAGLASSVFTNRQDAERRARLPVKAQSELERALSAYLKADRMSEEKGGAQARDLISSALHAGTDGSRLPRDARRSIRVSGHHLEGPISRELLMEARSRFEGVPRAKGSSKSHRSLLALCLSMLQGMLLGENAQETGDAAARAAVEEYARYAANENEHVRKAAVMELGGCNHELAVEPLLKALGDPAGAVREAAAQSLGKQTSRAGLFRLRTALLRSRNIEARVALLGSFQLSRPDLVYPAVIDLCKDSNLAVRRAAAETLGCLAPQEDKSELAVKELLLDREPDVRMAALDSAARLGLKAVVERCIELLDSDPDWRVRAAAIRSMASLRVEGVLQPLISALEREDGRLQDDCYAALLELTGEINFGPSSEEWQRWWDRVKDRYVLPAPEEIEKLRAREAASLAQYADAPRQFVEIPTRSKRIVFLIDVSTSMADRLAFETGDEARRKKFVERFGAYQTKIELAREELIRTVASLEGYVKFNMVTFHTEVTPWKKSLVPADSTHKNQAIKFLSRLTPGHIVSLATSSAAGRTNTFDALNEAFGLPSEALTVSTRTSHKAESDTVFLVTDGMPTAGRITEPGELVRYVEAANKRARIVFHTITFGHGNESLLKPIAERSGGQYFVISDR